MAVAATSKTSKKADKATWKKAKRHLITLPSGVEVTVQIPNLPLLVKTGYLPNELVSQALATIQSGKLNTSVIAEQADFFAKLVVVMVKEPELLEEDVVGDDAIPFEDVEMLVEFATRQRDIDALGHHLGGLHSSKQWRQFRGFDHIDSDVEGM